jgi:hypothetical protein
MASMSAILSTVARYSIPFGVVWYCLREGLCVQAARSINCEMYSLA